MFLDIGTEVVVMIFKKFDTVTKISLLMYLTIKSVYHNQTSFITFLDTGTEAVVMMFKKFDVVTKLLG